MSEKIADNQEVNATGDASSFKDGASSSQEHELPIEKKVLPPGFDADYMETKDIVLRKAEIQAATYLKSWFWTGVLFFSAFATGYGYGLDANIRYVYTATAAASYSEHSLYSTIAVVNAVIAAGSQVAFARLCDVFGRLYIFLVCIVFYVIGTIVESQATNIQNYCAGAVFYNLGYVGVLLVLLLILSDFSTLRWRLFYQFIPTLPYIINTWVSGDITSSVGAVENWSWGIGMWAFIFPLTCIPMVACMLHMRYLASKTEEWKLIQQKQTYYQKHGLIKSLTELFWRLDVLGIFVMVVSLGCILVPLTLAGGFSSKWSSGKIIGPLVLGFVLVPVWVLVETYVAKYPMAPFKLLKDRGIWAAIMISLLLDFIFYMAADYLYTVLIVAMNQSVKSATRISSISSFVGVVWCPFFALMIVYVKRLKVFIVLGCSLWFLAAGLLYHFRGGEGSIKGCIGGLVVWGIGTTMFSYPITVSMQSSTSHENMATVTALSYTLYRIGSAIGTSVSGAVWTQLLPARLEKDLGNYTLALEVYADPYTFCTANAWGTPNRMAVVESYKYIQRMETLIALCFCTLLVGFSLFLRDPVLNDQIAHEEQLADGELIYKKDSDPIADFFRGLPLVGRSKKATAESEHSESTVKTNC